MAVDRLVINLAELPDEGQNFAGELPVELFELSGKDVRALSPLTFQIRAQQFENELLPLGICFWGRPLEQSLGRTGGRGKGG